MRIWDIEPGRLCRQHLLGEHRELHAILVVLTQNKKGYAHHPETLRWKGRLKALYKRHEALVKEMAKRGYGHYSPFARTLAKGLPKQTKRVNTLAEQIKILRAKKCGCKV